MIILKLTIQCKHKPLACVDEGLSQNVTDKQVGICNQSEGNRNDHVKNPVMHHLTASGVTWSTCSCCHC